MKGLFLKELTALVARKRGIEADQSLKQETKRYGRPSYSSSYPDYGIQLWIDCRRRLEELTMSINGTRCSIDQLGLNFTVNPPSTVFTYEEMELIEGTVHCHYCFSQYSIINDLYRRGRYRCDD